jgi:hypothetical protein
MLGNFGHSGATVLLPLYSLTSEGALAGRHPSAPVRQARARRQLRCPLMHSSAYFLIGSRYGSMHSEHRL